jgi:ribosomal protein S6
LNTYEAVFILDSRKIEDNGETFSKEAETEIEKLGGKVTSCTSLGRKQFARPIGKHRAGNYWDFIIELDPAAVFSLKDRYRLNPVVLRLEVFHYDAAAVAEQAKTNSAAQRD